MSTRINFTIQVDSECCMPMMPLKALQDSVAEINENSSITLKL